MWGARPDGWFDYFSTQWTNYTGVGESDLLGWRWMEALHPDDREPTRQFWTESVAGRQPYDVEYRIRQSDGTYGWFKTRGTPIRDSDGTIVKWFGTCTDITDRKRAEQTLKDHELELRQALRQRFGKASPSLVALPQRLLRPPSRGTEPAHYQRQRSKERQRKDTIGHTNTRKLDVRNQRPEKIAEAKN